jgi:hypothetical protein
LSGYNSFIGGGYYNTASSNYSNVVGGVNNRASGFSSFIAAGSNNDSNNKDNTFILGSNITAISANYTYVNNLSAPGNICAGTFYGDGSNLTGASLPGQAGINSLVTNTSGNWNTAYNVATSYSSVSSSFATNTTLSTLSFNSSNNTLSISGIANVSLSSLAYSNTTVSNSYLTIQQFAASNPVGISKGSTVTLYNNRVYIFAGTNPSDPNQYVALNLNTYTPITLTVPLSVASPVTIDSFYLGTYKSSKYTLQVETNYNNDVYYSELNAVGTIASGGFGTVSEYGQVDTASIINGYGVYVSANTLYLQVYFNTTAGSNTITIKGLRSNFYLI